MERVNRKEGAPQRNRRKQLSAYSQPPTNPSYRESTLTLDSASGRSSASNPCFEQNNRAIPSAPPPPYQEVISDSDYNPAL